MTQGHSASQQPDSQGCWWLTQSNESLMEAMLLLRSSIQNSAPVSPETTRTPGSGALELRSEEAFVFSFEAVSIHPSLPPLPASILSPMACQIPQNQVPPSQLCWSSVFGLQALFSGFKWHCILCELFKVD